MKEVETWQKKDGVLTCPNCGLFQPLYAREETEHHWAGCEWSGKLKEKIKQQKFEGMRL